MAGSDDDRHGVLVSQEEDEEQFETRDAGGATIGPKASAVRSARPVERPGEVVLAARSLGTFTQGFGENREVTVFDSGRLVAEPRCVGAVALNFCIDKETSAGLELLVEVVVSKPLAGNRYIDEHTVLSKTAKPGETLLFTAEDGRQIVLSHWSRDGH